MRRNMKSVGREKAKRELREANRKASVSGQRAHECNLAPSLRSGDRRATAKQLRDVATGVVDDVDADIVGSGKIGSLNMRSVLEYRVV